MNYNDIFKKIRYIFNYNDSKMIELFGLIGIEKSRSTISNWLKKEEDPSFQSITTKEFAEFLNGLIVEKRGNKEGGLPISELELNNNIILRKLKIALNLKDEQMLHLLELANFKISKHELSAFFRQPSQSQYRVCHDQILRNFLHGMEIQYRI